MHQSAVSPVVLLVIAALIFVTFVHCKPQQHNQLALPEFGDDRISREFYGRVRDMLEHDVMHSDEPVENRADHVDSPSKSVIDTTYLDSPPKPKEVPNWPQAGLNVGQISAVAVDVNGNPVIFHRGQTVWDES